MVNKVLEVSHGAVNNKVGDASSSIDSDIVLNQKMMYSGQAAIDFLSTEISKEDLAASSYWQKHHSKFRFLGNGFEGLILLGGNEKPHRGLRLLLNRLLQRPFRRMGVAFRKFNDIDRISKKVAICQDRASDLDVLRQVLTLSYLHDRVPSLLTSKNTSCVIGDGFATMTALQLASRSAGRVILINLTKTLLVDLWYLKLWMGTEIFESSVDLVTDEASLSQALAKPIINETSGNVIAIQASNHELLRNCPIDIVLNIASMQEMNPPVIAAYFDHFRTIASRRRLVFYCCNREEKKLPDGTVIKFNEYPWNANDDILDDNLCPWYQKYYKLRPPFFHSYNGPIRHRLVNFK